MAENFIIVRERVRKNGNYMNKIIDVNNNQFGHWFRDSEIQEIKELKDLLERAFLLGMNA